MNFAVIEACIAEAIDPDDRRGAPRTVVALDARIRPFGAEGSAAAVLNLSATGFMAETAGEFVVGARVWLILRDRERSTAIVKWTDGNRLGAEFVAPLALAFVQGQGLPES